MDTPPETPATTTTPAARKTLQRKTAFELPDYALDVVDDSHVSSADVSTMTKGVELQNADNKKEDEDEEIALDGEFIKVERESFDVKESDLEKNIVVKGQTLSARENNLLLHNELEEAQKKIEKLNLELENLVQKLKSSESEKAQVRDEVVITNEKIREKEKHSEALELDLRRLKREALEAEAKYDSHLQSLREALEAQEAKYRELAEVKEAFDGISIELESSRTNVKKLEHDLSLSTEEAVKFEKLCKEKNKFAESESHKVLEFEKMLEIAKLNAKEMEHKMGAMQDELKELCDRNSENEQVKNTLNTTLSELSEVQEELGLSKSQVRELEQKVSSGVSTVEELTHELNQHRAAEDKLQRDLAALESMNAASKEELRAVLSSLQNVESKYEDELKKREHFEASLKSQDVQILNLQEQLLKVSGEKEALHAISVELTSNLANTKEMCTDLEDKLSLSNQNFSKTDALLSESMIYKSDLEQRLRSLEEFHRQANLTAESTTQRNLHLEDLIRSSHAAEEEIKTQMREIEMKLVSAKKRNEKLEQQLNLSDLKCNEKDAELTELHHKTSEMSQLESSLRKSSERNSELEHELKDLTEKCREHESRADSTHQRSLELEDLVQVSHSKSKDAENKVAETGLRLETTKYRVRELEEQLDIGYVKYKDMAAELKQSQSKVSELSAALEAFQMRSGSLEVALETATEKERELTDLLKLATEGKKNIEEFSKHSTKKLLEVEHQVEVLQNKLQLKKNKTRAAKEEIEASGARESEILLKLRATEELLETHGRKVEEATARSLELESLHETKSKDSDLKLQEILVTLSQKDAEVMMLHGRLKSIEEQATFYQDQASEATEWAVSLKDELDSSSMAQASLENTINVLKKEIEETKSKAMFLQDQAAEATERAALLKAELDVDSITRNSLEKTIDEIKRKVHETEAKAVSFQDQVSEVAERATFYQHQAAEEAERAASLKSELEARFHAQVSLESTIDELKGIVQEKEAKVAFYQNQTAEATEKAACLKVELGAIIDGLKMKVQEAEEKAGLHLTENELLFKTNSQLKENLEVHQTNVNELQELLSLIKAEKAAAAEQLSTHERTISDLTIRHSRGLELHSAAESHAKEIKTKFHDVMEKLALRDTEVKSLNEKLLSLEMQLKTYEQQANEAATYAESRKLELQKASLKISSLEGVVAELQTKGTEFKSENEGLANANLKLTQELAAYEAKLNELETAFNSVLADRQETSEQVHSSKKMMEDLKQQLASDGVKLQSQISSVMEENCLLNEMHQNTKKELQAEILQLTEELNKQKANENSLNSHIESLQAELIVKSKLQTTIEELENKLVMGEKQLTEEIEHIKSAASEKEQGLASKLDESLSKLKEIDVMQEQILEFQKDLHLAHAKVAELTEADSRKELEREASVRLPIREVETKNQHVLALEKQVEELKRTLHLTEEQCTEKVEASIKQSQVKVDADHQHTLLLEEQITELKHKLETAEAKHMEKFEMRASESATKDTVETSRDFEVGATRVSKRKGKKRTDVSQSARDISPANPTTGEEHSLGMTLKLILGVALVSMIIGAILGKRY